jgi:hypothetical protein
MAKVTFPSVEHEQHHQVVAAYETAQVVGTYRYSQSMRELFMGYAHKINVAYPETLRAYARTVSGEAYPEAHLRGKNAWGTERVGFALEILAGDNGVLSRVIIVALAKIVNSKGSTAQVAIYRAFNPQTETVIFNKRPELVRLSDAELIGYLAWVLETGQAFPMIDTEGGQDQPPDSDRDLGTHNDGLTAEARAFFFGDQGDGVSPPGLEPGSEV